MRSAMESVRSSTLERVPYLKKGNALILTKKKHGIPSIFMTTGTDAKMMGTMQWLCSLLFQNHDIQLKSTSVT